jgi:transcriptional regulator GlxA family with amidase domain
MNIAILSADGAVTAPLAVMLDLIFAANAVLETETIKVKVFGPAPFGVQGQLPLPLEPFSSMQGENYDAVVIPGLGHSHARAPELYIGSTEAAGLMDVVATAHSRNAWIAASCTGSFVPAHLGFLDGGEATTSWWLAPRFRSTFPKVLLREEHLVREHHRVLTGGGALAQIELGLALLRKFIGIGAAETVSQFLVSPRRGPQSASSSVVLTNTNDPIVSAFIAYIGENIEEPISLEAAAIAVMTTKRTLERRVQQFFGTTPVGLLRRMRAEKAIHLLRSTRLPMKSICEKVGYQDENSLRQLLVQTTGLTPKTIRTLG